MGVPLMAASLIGGAVSAVGSYSSAMYQSGVMKANAQLAQQNANATALQGQEAQYQQGVKTAAEVSQQQAAFAGNGINGQSASVQNVIAGTRTAGEQNQSMLRFNSEIGFENYQNQANQDKAQAGQLATAAPINALTTILGSATSVGNQYLNFQKFGTPSAKSLGLPSWMNFGTNS